MYEEEFEKACKEIKKRVNGNEPYLIRAPAFSGPHFDALMKYLEELKSNGNVSLEGGIKEFRIDENQINITLKFIENKISDVINNPSLIDSSAKDMQKFLINYNDNGSLKFYYKNLNHILDEVFYSLHSVEIFTRKDSYNKYPEPVMFDKILITESDEGITDHYFFTPKLLYVVCMT